MTSTRLLRANTNRDIGRPIAAALTSVRAVISRDCNVANSTSLALTVAAGQRPGACLGCDVAGDLHQPDLEVVRSPARRSVDPTARDGRVGFDEGEGADVTHSTPRSSGRGSARMRLRVSSLLKLPLPSRWRR